MQHQENKQQKIQGKRLLMPLLLFVLQWGQIVDVLTYYFLHSFLAVRLLSYVTPKARMSLFKRFKLVFKTVIQLTTTKNFSWTCGSLFIVGIQTKVNFLCSRAQNFWLLIGTQEMQTISGGMLQHTKKKIMFRMHQMFCQLRN